MQVPPPKHLHDSHIHKTLFIFSLSFTIDFLPSPLLSTFFLQLEVLPAAGMPNLLGLKQWQPAPIIDGGGNTASGTPPITNSKNDRKNHGGGSDAATRALAALPKGMRFSAPKAADKSRAAQRRQLAASARTVANDRWAAQLGYQDGEEHIRDLK